MLVNWRKRVGAFIPRYVPNRLVVDIMRFLSVLKKTSRKNVEKNRVHNTKILEENVVASETRCFYKPDEFIENQRQWQDVRFGSKYTIAYGGCGVIAVYNALFSLGQKLKGRDVVEMISELEQNGAVWAGCLGIAPEAMRRFFKNRGYHVYMTLSRDKEAINALVKEYDTFIVTVYNDAENIFRHLHNVSITRDERGRYWGHNCYKRVMTVSGDSVYVSDGPHPGLWEAIHRMSDGRAEILSVIGIRN